MVNTNQKNIIKREPFFRVGTSANPMLAAVQVLDALGKPKPMDQSRIIFPSLNLSGAQK